jgi:hypothetical protein
MTVGFRNSGGTDLDSIFMAYVSGTKAALTGFKNSAGTDLRDIYQPYTLGAQASAVGYKISSGSDLNTLFQNISVPLFTPADGITDVSVFETLATAIAQLQVKTDGTCGAGSWGTPTTTGIGSSYYVKVVKTLGDAVTGDTQGSYIQITSNRTWSLSVSTTPGNSATKSCTLEVSISADGVNALYTATVNLEATADLT